MNFLSVKKSRGQRSEQFVTTPLFPELEPEIRRKIRTYKRIEQPIWTENKAHFVQQYLRFFLQITKHGTYIDGFAGPQSFDHLDAWTAALVLSIEPKWLRHFFLCELSKKGLNALKQLVELQPEPRDRKGKKLPRRIEILSGDFNLRVTEILQSTKIAQKEATFCPLLISA